MPQWQGLFSFPRHSEGLCDVCSLNAYSVVAGSVLHAENRVVSRNGPWDHCQRGILSHNNKTSLDYPAAICCYMNMYKNRAGVQFMME